MVAKMATKKNGHRARVMLGVNRVEQAERIKEIIGAMPEGDRSVLVKVRAKLDDKGILLADPTIKKHMEVFSSGAAGGLEERIEAAAKALKVCGGLKGFNNTLKFMNRIKRVIQ